jgi:predicted  nucleic acid-binding Zn-ribbon protein
MPSKLSGLPALQAIDRQLCDLHIEVVALEAKLRPLEEEKQKFLAKLAAHEAEKKELKKSQGMSELVLKEKETLLAKLEQQLLTVNTNKEYAAFQKEIGTVKADRSAIEDKILEAMDAVDNIDKRIAGEKKEAQELEKKFASLVAEVDSGRRALNERIAALEKDRPPAAEKVDSSVLELYERVGKRHTDARIVSYVKIETAPNGRIEGASCGECGISITTQELNRCMQDKEIMVCRSCSRILYLE